MKPIKLFSLLLLVSISVIPNTLLAKDKPTMAVLAFSNDATSSTQGWWGGGYTQKTGGVGEELADMLTNELAGTKSFRMIERKELQSILGEQDLSQSGRVSPGSGVKIGELTGAQYLVTASVSAYENNVQGNDAGLSYKGISLGGKRAKVYLAVDLRVIDSTTGEIADTRTVEARSKSGGLRIGANRNGYSGALASQNKTPTGKVIRAVIAEISDYLVCSMVKKNKCLAKFEAKEEKRREGLKEGIELD